MYSYQKKFLLNGLDAASSDGQSLATSFGTMVGTLGTVLFYGTATINLAWQHIGWKAVEKGNFKKLYVVDMVLPWISHIICSFIPAMIMCKMGAPMVDLIKTYLPMDGIAMKTLFTLMFLPLFQKMLLTIVHHLMQHLIHNFLKQSLQEEFQYN